MYICTLHTDDPGYVPATAVATGNTLDELVEGISDELADSFGPGPDKALSVSDEKGNTIGDDIYSVCQAVHDGTTCIVVRFPTHQNIFSIIEI